MQDVTSIEYLKDTFKIGYEAYESSRTEAEATWDAYHNRHYTTDQLNNLANRGQPAETFNVLKVFTRMILGYYSSVINHITVKPVSTEDIITSSVLNDLVSHTLRVNNFVSEGDKLKLSGLISGLMCAEITVEDTDVTDSFGRAVKQVRVSHVPSSEIVLDPGSVKDDYSDARYICRFKWLAEETIIALYGEANLKKMQEHYNFTNQADAEYATKGREIATGVYRVHNNYLVVHSVVKDAKGRTWSIHWYDDIKLSEEEITYKEVSFPYRVTKIHSSDNLEYYGIYREVLESQKAINQALIKLQQIINSQKVLVEEGAVEDLAEFIDAYNRVSGVIPVTTLAGIKVVDGNREAAELYVVIDKAFDRIQRVLGINDSFLGMAFASDSGRKVKLQQNASITALHYLTSRIELFYRLVGWDIANLIKQTYKANQILRIADETSGERFIEINKPLETFTGRLNPDGSPVMQVEYEEVLNPATAEPEVDEEGNYLIAPIPEPSTDLEFTKVEIAIDTAAYNDEDEKNQLMLEQVLASNVGQMLAQVNPAGFFKVAGLSVKSMKTKNALEIANIFANTAEMLGASQQQAQQAQGMAQEMPGQLAQQPQGQQTGAQSRTLNLPQNTNEK